MGGDPPVVMFALPFLSSLQAFDRHGSFFFGSSVTITGSTFTEEGAISRVSGYSWPDFIIIA